MNKIKFILHPNLQSGQKFTLNNSRRRYPRESSLVGETPHQPIADVICVLLLCFLPGLLLIFRVCESREGKVWCLPQSKARRLALPWLENPVNIENCTEIGKSIGTWYGEICSCPCLASRNKFHQTTYKDFSRSLY